MTTSRWIGTDTVSPDSGAGAERDVHRPEDLLVLEDVAGQPGLVVRPDAELGEIRPELALGQQQLDELRTEAALRCDEPPLRHRQRRGFVADPERREARCHERALSERRRDEPLPARQVPERPSRAQLAVVRDPGPPVERELEIRAARARDPRRRRRVERRRDRLGARRHRVEVDRHHAREHVRRDPRHRRPARPSIARPLARARVTQRPARRRDEHVGRLERGRHRRRRLGAVGRALVHDHQDGVGAGGGRLLSERLADRRGGGIDDDHDVLAGLHGQASAHDGLHCRGEVAHRRRIICPAGCDRPHPIAGYTRGRAGVAQSVRAAES